MSMNYRVSKESPTRICTQCKREYPNTTEYFYWNSAYQTTRNICKKCYAAKAKIRHEKLKESFGNKKIVVYSNTKKCIKCNRELPNDSYHFVIDKTTVSGLRNVCRECDPKSKGFLSNDFVPPEKWDEESLKILKDNYYNYTNAELKEKFFPNRSKRSIENAAYSYGYNGKSNEVKQIINNERAKILSNCSKGRILSEETKKRISDTKKEYYKTHKPYWTGKKRSLEQRQQISQRMKGHWSGDSNPRHISPLYANQNGRWKGGIKTVYDALREEIRDWQDDSMQFCNFKCIVSHGEFDDIHHTTPFEFIIREACACSGLKYESCISDYSTEDFDVLRRNTILLHDKYGYGACLNKGIHKLFHDSYGYTNISPADFLDFLYCIDNNVYSEWFKKNNLAINMNYQYLTYLESILKSQ